ncbi:MAG: 5-methyltetrahydropteroyltriglutamate--homocysteine S-methyltransferase [Rhodospirillaceae bacterium]|nr:5-methyltetrahydropteroyltriglutamate--homocysteine S-methyltransferase [Rhodospirillaceae bacterium]
MATPPFRAEHIGSLLRPEKLLKARAALEGDQYRTVSGSTLFSELKGVEDEAIRDAVSLQESAGLQSITDGEFRRRSWYQDFLLSLGGTAITFVDASKTISAAMPFEDAKGVEKLPGHLVQVTGKLSRKGGIFTEHFKFLKAATKRTPKATMPAPTMLHFWGGRPVIDAKAYPELGAFWDDCVDIWLAEIRDLHALGCTYVQLDDVTWPLLCDPRGQEAIRQRGEDPDKIVEMYADVLNRIAAGVPKGVTLGMHMCRGNNRGKWMGNGGYEYVSEVLFRNVAIDTYFMEYDSDRAGDFRPLRHVPPGKTVVLGLVSSKTTALESKDDLKRRIDQAAQYMPHDHLCLSPQCGFASNFMGNPVTIEDEKRKLGLVVEVAGEVWGKA